MAKQMDGSKEAPVQREVGEAGNASQPFLLMAPSKTLGAEETAKQLMVPSKTCLLFTLT